jgi:peptide/nickel transport system permease protein
MSLDRGSEAARGGELVQVEPGVVIALRPKRTLWLNVVYFATRKPLGAFGATVAIILVILAAFAGVISTHDPYRTNVQSGAQYANPSAEHWFGGDHLGRDVFSRVIHGARVSLYVGVASAFLGSSMGLILGVASVQLGGKVDLAVQRVVDAMMAFPGLILAIAIMSALGASVHNVVIALTVAFVPSTARIVRSQSLAIIEMDYVLAARAVGAGNWRIILRHIIPNIFALYLVVFTFYIGGAIISEAGLSFLGVGSPIDTPSWGGMLSGATRQYVSLAPWLAVFPGLAIFVVVFSWNVLGDALRDVLDPRLRGTD